MSPPTFTWCFTGYQESPLFNFDEISVWKFKIHFENEFMIIKLHRIQGCKSYIFKVYINNYFTNEIITFDGTVKTWIKPTLPKFFIIVQYISRKKIGITHHFCNINSLYFMYERLLNTGEHGDIVLKCHNQTFIVHSFILAHRVPLFYEKIVNVQYKITNISPQSLKVFLQFIYTGNICLKHFNTVLDLYKMFQTYDLGLDCFKIFVNDILYIDDDWKYYQNYSFNVYMNKHQWKFISLNNVHLLLVFYFKNQHVTLVIYYLFGSEDIYIEIDRSQRFKIDVNNRQCNFYVNSMGLDTYFQVEISNSQTFQRIFPSFQYSRIFTGIEFYNDMTQLSDDLADVDIQFVDGSLKTFKALLVVKSPVFESMFKYNFRESQTNKIIIDDFDISTGKKFIYYLKSAKVEKCDDIFQLYLFADKYIITDLFTKCSNLIYSDYMSLEYVNNILKISDLCLDNRLKNASKKLIAQFPSLNK